MSDDLREREPERELSDVRPGDGIPSDRAGTGAGVTGPAPAGGDPEALASGPAGDPEPPGGLGTTAGGGYGSDSTRQSSGGTGEGQEAAGDDAQTDWLRDAEGGSSQERRSSSSAATVQRYPGAGDPCRVIRGQEPERCRDLVGAGP